MNYQLGVVGRGGLDGGGGGSGYVERVFEVLNVACALGYVCPLSVFVTSVSLLAVSLQCYNIQGSCSAPSLEIDTSSSGEDNAPHSAL